MQARFAFHKNKKVSDRELTRKGILVGVREMFSRHRNVSARLRRYQGASYYDREDRVRVTVDSEGDMVFEKVA